MVQRQGERITVIGEKVCLLVPKLSDGIIGQRVIDRSGRPEKHPGKLEADH